MSTRKQAGGKRSIEMEFDVPGSPDQVWRAIATGPGVSSWFMPCEVEEREGGKVAFQFAPGVESTGLVTCWAPPQRFGYEESEWLEGAPALASEFIVEVTSGQTCRVRLVHSLFTESDQWDDQFDGFERGWLVCFEILREYLRHFDGLACTPLHLMGTSATSEDATWRDLLDQFELTEPAVGQRVAIRRMGDAPLEGEIIGVGRPPDIRNALIRLDAPGPGLVQFSAHTWGGQVHASVGFFFYGDDATAIVQRESPRWRAWLDERYPSIS
jgi:uncharacterized protein YndB with AHSA1/START domain